MRIFKSKMQFSDALDNALMMAGMIFRQHVSQSSGNFFRRRSDMTAHPDIFAAHSESSRDIIADIGNEHFMKRQYAVQVKFLLFGFLADVRYNAREVFGFKNFPF